MSADHENSIAAAKPDLPECPACRRVMSIRQVTPSASTIGVRRTVYVCEGCGTEAYRAAKAQ